ncbi:MAG: hypothetical protein R8F63_16365 [Acidimicrobiales bacterium]|nr:hypothetical protein [Acidimicrobiales bacterium]
MPFRQIATVVLGLIAILGAALFVLSWGDDEPEDADVTDNTDGGAVVDGTDGTDGDDGTDGTTTTTTTVAPVTTSIPVDCGTTPDDSADTTTTTTTTTEPAADDEGDETGDDEGEEEPEAPLVPTLDSTSSLSTVGLDEVTFGLTVNEARTEAGTEFINCGLVTDCYRVVPDVAPDGISFVVHEGTIERVDIVGNSPITTRSGAGIGTTDEQLDALFGDRLERVDLGGGQVDVIFVPQDENDQEFRVAFTTVDGVVETMRAGRVPLVLEADPCG